ncbi:NADPH-cytochrome p450 reductase-like protein [Leishmania tarentolae]|uniref:NADPH-cytochrome p450 reductase-like protein n=1 Tax=Leishmania tarentolae TaxID=5689 RepID=A0A640KS18_LEITA|nr:NADPH-cytochrome p450 reductase-like protein [Leishmania tarentolae]
MDKLTILYGTQTGNAERLALRIARLALRQGFECVSCLPADDLSIAEWPHTGGPVVLVCSNANQGDAPNTFRRSWESLLQPTAASMMEGLRYAVFGLGDSLYLKFNHMAKMVHNRLRQLGGTPIVARGLGDESDAKGVEETLQPWLAELWTALERPDKCGTAARVLAHSQEDLPFFPLYSIASASACDEATGGEPFSKATVAPLPYFAHSVFSCEVVANKRLTSAACEQVVHHLELCASPESIDTAAYDVGDALGIYCPNREEQVEELLQRLHRDGSEVVVVTPDASHGVVRQPARPFFGRPISLRSLLRHYFDLDAVVPQEFLWMLAHAVTEEDEAAADVRERLYELADPSNVNDYLQYAHREKRNICEVLHDFKDLHPSLEWVLSFAIPMLPRYFSIASAPAMDGAGRFDLCVGLLDWHTPLKRHRTGLCSSYLVRAPPGTRLTCFVWQGTLALPATPTPLLCIATGTGVAPIRSVLRQVAGLSAQGWKDVPVVLVFGCRHEAEDYLYREEWATLKEVGALPTLRVIPAFSRDTDKKVYVQHKLGQHARLTSSFLQPESTDSPPGVVYVCGNAKQMPKDVQHTLEQIVEATVAGVQDEAGAAAHVRALGRVGRYQIDSWSA